MSHVLAGPSLAHTYGNVTSFYVELIKDLFPEGYFKTVHIASKVAFREFNIFQNKNKEYFKKSKPMLIIRPRVDINSSDEFLKGSYLTTRIAHQLDASDNGNLQEFITDKDNGRMLKFLLNRMTMLFDISIITETQMEQLNVVTFLKNRLMSERPFMIDTCLENIIPRELLKLLAEDTNNSMETDEGTQKFLKYLNTHSLFPITYKLKNSTGNDEFFRYYPVNLDTLVSQYDIDDGSKKGFIHNAFTINFTISSEFWIAGLYYYFTPKPQLIGAVSSSIDANGTIIPMYTVSNLYSHDLPEGWKLYTSPMYRVDYNKKPDIMDISGLLNTSICEVLKYHKTHNISNKVFIETRVIKDNKVLSDDEYNIDWDKLELTTLNTNILSTYRLMIYINPMYINNLISILCEFNQEK